MIPENFKQLIDKLGEKTVSKKAIWNKASGLNEFKLDLTKGAITIDRFHSEDDDKNYVDMIIYNDRGDIIDRLIFKEGDADANELIKLHTEAKRAYFKVDETLKSILSEISNDRTIGKEKKTDEGLPF